MGHYSSSRRLEVRMEFMQPGQIDAAKHRRAAVYVAFGSIEWHGRHNAIGLDTLKAHEQLVGLAQKIGGVVYPPVHFGAGGGHGGFPYTYLFDPQTCRRIVLSMLQQFERDGFQAAILLAGHYPNPTEYLVGAVTDYRAQGGQMRVLVLQENQVKGIEGQHAGMLETSFMMFLHPETVDLSQLEGREDDRSGPETKRDWMESEHREHPCYGIVDVDPRGNASRDLGKSQTERLQELLTRWLNNEEVATDLKWQHTP